jgi:peptide/nickel transport system substrate-binding protein
VPRVRGQGDRSSEAAGVARDYELHLAEEAAAGRLSRKELLRRAAVVGLSASTVQLLAACQGDDDEGAADSGERPRRGGTLVFGTPVSGREPDPWFAIDTGGVVTAQLACEYLVRPGQGNVLRPALAESWRPGATTREWTFDLRRDVRFHDGTALTADDVVATFDVIADPKRGSSALSAFGGVLSRGGIEKAGEHRVRFHLDRPYADFPYLVSNYTYSAVILPRTYEPGTFVQGGVGTGPYVLRDYVPTQQARYVRNGRYWRRGLPYLEGVTLRYYADYAAIVLALQSGEADVTLEARYQGSQALFDNPSIRMQREPSSAYRALHLRVDRPPLDSPLVRRAIALSLDRPALVQGLYSGRADIGNDHAFAPVYPTHPDTPAQRRQDYAEARRLLEQAGHPRGLALDLTIEQFEDVPQYGIFAKEMCKPAGIDVKLEILSQAQYYGSGANQPWLSVPAGITDWASRGTASQTIGPAYRCGAVWNSAHWCDERFERLMREFDGELDVQRRRRLAADAAKIQHDAVPAVIAYWIDDLRASRTSVRGLSSGPRPDMATIWQSA